MISRIKTVAVVSCCALLGVAMIAGTAEAKKKKSKGGSSKVATVSNVTPRAIPDAVASATGQTVSIGVLATPLTVSKKFKGNAKSVALTIQTTGTDTDPTDPSAADDLNVQITAPDGTTVGGLGPFAFGGGFDIGNNVGPLTIVPNSPFGVCAFNPNAVPAPTPPPPPCADPNDNVNAPYVGTIGDAGLNLLKGAPVKGTWTVRVTDNNPHALPAPQPATSVLNQVALKITPDATTTTTTSKKKKK